MLSVVLASVVLQREVKSHVEKIHNNKLAFSATISRLMEKKDGEKKRD